LLSDLLSTTDPLLVACADVSRRRALLTCELDPARFGRPSARFLSDHCTSSGTAVAPSVHDRDVCLIDYETFTRMPQLAARFVHVFALDPPPFAHTLALLQQHGCEEGASYLHLGWGEAEVEFARKVAEHDFGLRGPLAAIYRALAAHPGGLAAGALANALKGEGRHPRTPTVVGRCLRVLVELGLARVEGSSATVSCTIISRGKVQLERSEAFQVYTSLYREALRFLSENAQPMRTASAA
jgi:single-stranded-DNA-specific exonuclease